VPDEGTVALVRTANKQPVSTESIGNIDLKSPITGSDFPIADPVDPGLMSETTRTGDSDGGSGTVTRSTDE
jgi:hypothetical protein